MSPARGKANPPVSVDVVFRGRKWSARKKWTALAGRAVAAAAAAGPPLTEGTELAVIFTDNAELHRLNRSFREKDTATNVLSFPVSAGKTGRFGPLLGDIFVAFETVAAEAKASGVPVDDHAIHLIVHGYLHLVGHDHHADDEAAVMENLETAILSGLGIADPYSRLE